MLRPWRAPVRAGSIAVLPFESLGSDPQDQYFSEGITEELTTAFGKLRELRVVARTSAEQFRGKAEDVRRIGRALNVDAVMEGSVRRSGSKLRVTAQLIDTHTGYHLWSAAYDEDEPEIFDAEDDIVRQSVQILGIRLPSAPGVRLAKRDTSNSEAHALYVQGRYLFSKRDPQSMNRSVQLFNQAAQLDPNYAEVYAGLANSFSVMAANEQMDSSAAIPLAEAAATRALTLDPGLAAAHESLGLVKRVKWDLRGAEQEFRRALQLNPNDATAHHSLGIVYTVRGRFAEADAEQRAAQTLDPLSLMNSFAIAQNLQYWRRWNDSIREAERILQLDPDSAAADGLIAAAYRALGRPADAIAQYQKMLALEKSDHTGLYFNIACASGNHAEALRLMRRMEDPSHSKHIPPYYLAGMHADVGENEAALHWLETAYTQKDPDLISVKVDPAFDSLRSDPRYQKLIQEIGLD